jgi:hypothetical protein
LPAIKPLGYPPADSAKVTHALNQYWQRKNAAKKNGLTGEALKQHSSSTNVSMAGGGAQRRWFGGGHQKPGCFY